MYDDDDDDGGGVPSPPSTGTSESDAAAAYNWQQKRRRPSGAFDLPTPGFAGPGGLARMTLWLPSPRVERRYAFKNGRAVSETLPSCLDAPELRALRDRVVRSFTRSGPELLDVCYEFLDYAAAVVLMNYDLPDEELTLVLSGDAWISAMVRHCFGGDDVVRALLASRALLPPKPPPPPPQPVERPAVPSIEATAPQPAPSRGWFRRMAAWARRGR